MYIISIFRYIFNSYIKSNSLKQDFKGTIWGEGPCYIPHKKMLVWSDIPNNRMLKYSNGVVDEYKNPSNYCNGNTIDNNENLISCSHGGRCVYKTDNDNNISIIIAGIKRIPGIPKPSIHPTVPS